MADPAFRPALTLNIEDLKDEHHAGPFSQCKSCQSSISYTTSPRTLNKHGMITRGTTASAARSAVFNTPELFENILSMLPEQVLLTARQVTIHWNAVIMTSPRLRRKLFLQAEPVRHHWTAHSTPEKADGTKDRSEDLEAEILYLTIPAKLNPMLFKTPPAHLRKSLVERVEDAESIYLLASPDLARTGILHHSMLVSQPPALQLTIYFEYDIIDRTEGKKSGNSGGRYPFRHERRAQHLSREVKNPLGVTFGDILKEFHAGVKASKTTNRPSTEISIRAGYRSSLGMSGVVFATDKEREMVSKGLL